MSYTLIRRYSSLKLLKTTLRALQLPNIKVNIKTQNTQKDNLCYILRIHGKNFKY